VDNAPQNLNFGYAPVMQTSVQTTTYFKDGSTGTGNQIYDPNQVVGNSYNLVTQPTGQDQFYVSQNPLPDNYGQTTVTPVTKDQVDQQDRVQFIILAGSVGISLATDGAVDTEGVALDATATATRASFYVTADGTAIPATGYRAIGGTEAVAQAQNGNIMSLTQPTTYITFTDISGMSGAEAGDVLQLKYEPSHYAQFDTLQIIDDISIPGGKWNTSPIPEPITSTYPKFGSGGATQTITTTPIKNYTLQPFQ
jgi:hypothetical protein